MNFTDLLQRDGIDPKNVIAVRHAELLDVLPWFAEENPEVFNSYQQCQSLRLEAALMKLRNVGYLASFIAFGPARAMYVGLYKIGNSRAVSQTNFWAISGNQQLKEYGYKGFTASQQRPTIEHFDLKLTLFRKDWKGKLIIDWPGQGRSWWRRAEKNNFQVRAILEESALTQSMPPWNELALTWDQLRVIPKSWKEALRQWRGIYYIHDSRGCKGYVGSAGGTDNLLGRWMNYAQSGHGSNKLLKGRNPKTFTFSILELVSQTMIPSDLNDLERTWKKRLVTRHPFGLNDN